MWFAYTTRNIHNKYCLFLLGVKANLFCVVGLYNEEYYNNYCALLLGVRTNLFCARLAYRTRNINNNYNMVLLGVEGNYFCLVVLRT